MRLRGLVYTSRHPWVEAINSQFRNLAINILFRSIYAPAP
jgi:hypothetical protein